MPSRPFCSLGCLLVACLALGCGVSVDPVTSGQLCLPVRDGCPRQTTVRRPPPGVNRLDVAVINEGSGRPTVQLEIRDARSSLEPRDGGPSDARDERSDTRTSAPAEPDVGTGRAEGDVARRTYRPSEGERTNDRFVPVELPEADALTLRLSCRPTDGGTCRVRVEYVFSTERPQCESDGDCRGELFCDTQIGQCVECRNDGDCEPNQTCNPNNGRCIPQEASGCQSAPSPASSPGWPLVLLVVTLSFGSLVRRRFSITRGLAAAGVGLTLIGVPGDVDANPPDASIALETGPRWVLGDLGRHAKRGLGLTLRQGLRTTYVGGEAWVGTNYFLTTQQPPPLTRELQIYAFGLGPNVYIPLGDFEIGAGGGYQRVGFAPNSLLRQTPPDARERSNFHALGGHLGVTYRWYVLRVGVRASMYSITDVPASLLSIDVSIGLSTR